MSSFFNCSAYDDVEAGIRLERNVVFLALKDKNASVHITFNPLQVRILAKYLTDALDQIDFTDLPDEQHLGNLVVNFEHVDDFSAVA